MKSQAHHSRRRALGALVFLWLAGHIPSQDAAPLTVYFHNTESNVNNFALLKGEFDAFLATRDGHRFQPVGDRGMFESEVASKRRTLFLLSSSHYRQLAVRIPLEPLLVGEARGKATQRHLLYSSVADVATLRGQPIAHAGTRDNALALLKQLFPGQPGLFTPEQLLAVPKDIDALTAISFGSAKAALATESGADKLGNINPRQRAALKPLGQARESLLPILAAPKDADAAVRAAAREFLAPEAKRGLQLLGLEAFRELTAEQRKSLSP